MIAQDICMETPFGYEGSIGFKAVSANGGFGTGRFRYISAQGSFDPEISAHCDPLQNNRERLLIRSINVFVHASRVLLVMRLLSWSRRFWMLSCIPSMESDQPTGPIISYHVFYIKRISLCFVCLYESILSVTLSYLKNV